MTTAEAVARVVAAPHAREHYRQLRDAYAAAGRERDARAVDHLLEVKFDKKNAENNKTGNFPSG